MLAWWSQRALVLGASVVFGALAGCSVFDPSLVEQDAGASDGGQDGATLGPRCTSASRRPPSRPGPETAGEDGPDVIWVLREIDLQQGNDWRDIGFDLDGYCTDDELYTSCLPPDDVDPQLDGFDGIDNTFGNELYPLVERLEPGLEEDAQTSQDNGLGAIIMRVRGWNGTANDNNVEVLMAQTVIGGPPEISPEEITINDAFHGYTADETRVLPRFDGNDWFLLRSDAFVIESDLDTGRLVDDTAYVRDGTIVFSLPDRSEIIFSSTIAGVAVRLTDSINVAELSEDLSHPERVVLAGRWSINDLLDTARALGVCDEDPEFTIFRNAFEEVADIRSDPDESGAIPCNAVSVGVTLVGYGASIAGTTDGPTLPNNCE